MVNRTGRQSRNGRPAGFGGRALTGREREISTLEQLLATVRGGGSGALSIRGEPGVGKSALLQHLIDLAAMCNVVRATGVEGEVDLPYAGLQQLCRSMSDGIAGLPEPQRDALRVAFGLAGGPPPDRYIVGLAALTLLSEAAGKQPVLCVIDDVQWLDRETTHALAFIARRLGADSVALVFATREAVEELEGIEELRLEGLGAADARTLLDSVLIGRVDDTVRDRFLAETHGNPLALIELSRTLAAVEPAVGIVRRQGRSLSARIEDGFVRQLAPLSVETRRLLVVAAAEPLGDPLLLLRAAAHLGLGVEALDAAEEAGLFEIRERCSFRHPVLRSVVYASATRRERRLAHQALATATDPTTDPDRRAWHRAQATVEPDEGVAFELERTAARAKGRGGLAAAAAFLERAAVLTPDPSKRAERGLRAAESMFEAGAFDAVEALLAAVENAALDDYQAARAVRLHALVAEFTSGSSAESVRRLLAAADRLDGVDAAMAHDARLEALRAAFSIPDPDLLAVVAGALNRLPASRSGEIANMILRGWAQLLSDGFPAGVPLLRDAVVALLDKTDVAEADLPLLFFCTGIAISLWDLDAVETLARRTVEGARQFGALSMLPRALDVSAWGAIAAGDFPAAAAALAEEDAVVDAIRGYQATDSVLLDAWRLVEADALRGIEEQARNPQHLPYWNAYIRAVAHNSAGRYPAALEAAQRSCDLHPLGTYTAALVELVEAAARCSEQERAETAFHRLVERTRVASTDWALGLEARSAALVTAGAGAEPRFREAIDRLGRTRARPDLARAHLVYGEWLRREGRRIDAREQLRTALDSFNEMGAPSFAERTRRELAATGETARKRTDETRDDLTAQELQIARLAADGATNQEIGAQLFLSPRTVEWHLRSVFPKLSVSSRRELRTALRSG